MTWRIRAVLHEHVEHRAFLGAGKTCVPHSRVEQSPIALTELPLLCRLDVVALLAGLSSLHDLPYIVSQLRALEDLHHEVERLVDAVVFRADADLVAPLACFHVAQAMD